MLHVGKNIGNNKVDSLKDDLEQKNFDLRIFFSHNENKFLKYFI